MQSHAYVSIWIIGWCALYYDPHQLVAEDIRYDAFGYSEHNVAWRHDPLIRILARFYLALSGVWFT